MKGDIILLAKDYNFEPKGKGIRNYGKPESWYCANSRICYYNVRINCIVWWGAMGY